MKKINSNKERRGEGEECRGRGEEAEFSNVKSISSVDAVKYLFRNHLNDNSAPTPPPTLTSTLPLTPTRIWAPLNIPLIRRLQTFSLLFLMSVPVVAFILSYGCLISFYSYPIIFYCYLGYIIYIFFFQRYHQEAGGELRSNWMRSLPVWDWFAGYFPITIHKSVDLPDDTSYIFGYHPHGIISIGAISAFATSGSKFSTLFPSLTPYLVTLGLSFRVPFFGLFLSSMGFVAASQESCKFVLNQRKGNVLVIVLGGAIESLDAFDPKSLPTPYPAIRRISSAPSVQTYLENIIQKNEKDVLPTANYSSSAPQQGEINSINSINSSNPSLSPSQSLSPSLTSPNPTYPLLLNLNRRGFIRLSLLTGSSLVPVFGFGEVSVYDQISNPRGSVLRQIQLWFERNFGFATPLVKGRGIFQYAYGILPNRKPINVYIGKPIKVPKTDKDDITRDMLNYYHSLYLKELDRLFEGNKHKFPSSRDATLVMVEEEEEEKVKKK